MTITQDINEIKTKVASSVRRHMLHNPLSPFVYDFEVIRNCYTFVNYYYTENRFVVYVAGNPEIIDIMGVISKAQTIFKPIIETRFNGKEPTFDVALITTQNFLDVFETPQAYAVGFNSVSYDMSIASFIVDYIKEYNVLPPTQTVRMVSDLMIDAHKAFDLYPELALIARDLRIYLKPSQRKMGIIDIDSILHHRKMRWGDSKWNKIKNDWLISNFHLDVLLLNPVKSDEEKTELIGLKRVAAQFGIQIIEPNLGIDLGDSLAEINREQLTELLGYNASDSFVTYLIFMDDLFQDQIKVRVKLLEDYKDRFRNRVNINSTNAKLVTQYIAPDHALVDDPQSTTFFPVWDEKHKGLIEQIKNTYPDGHTYQQMLDMDQQWTNYIQQLPGYGPTTVLNPFSNQNVTYPRFRVRYGELQQDLLEHLRESYPNTFPMEAYHYYSLYRYSDNRRQLTKDFVEAFPEPPLGFTYGKKKHKYTGEDTYGIYYEFVIPGTSIRVNCSIGGVHGDAMFSVDYDTVANYLNKQNNILAALKDQFGEDATEVLKYIKENGDCYELKGFGTITLSEYITKTGATRNYKRPVKVPPRKDFVSIVDLENIVHADVTSLYPSIIIILRFFATWNHTTNKWDDPYADQKDLRVAMKALTEAVPEPEWTEKEFDAEMRQLSAKLFLNNASGVIDGESQSNIRMNRNAVSMRLVGQLILLDVVFAVVEQNGECVSINTDGVYITNLNIDGAKKIVRAWEQKYALEAEPEIVTRFVSKDSNNRYEVINGGKKRAASGGMLSNFKRMNYVKKWTQPPIVDEALINYFDNHHDVPNTPIEDFDIDSIKKFFSERLELFKDPNATYSDKLDLITRLCWPLQAGKTASGISQYFKLINESEDHPLVEPLNKISRMVFTKSGYKLVNGNMKKLTPNSNVVAMSPLEEEMFKTVEDNGLQPAPLFSITKAKVANYNDYRCTILNQDLSTVIDHPIWESNIDIDAYVDITVEKLMVWNNFTPDKLKKRKWHVVKE